MNLRMISALKEPSVMNRPLQQLLALAVLALCASCATPKYLTEDFTMGDQTVKYIMTPAAQMDVGGKKKEQLYNFVVRVCQLDGKDGDSSCKDSTVVENVVSTSIY